MKIQVIGDIHGSPLWKYVMDISCDKIVFLGDYTDSFSYTADDIISNLKEIIDLKTKYPDKIILLLGNHDVQYMLNTPYSTVNLKYNCSGYKPESHFDLYDIFSRYSTYFNIAHQYKTTIFTHAGLHAGWYRFYTMQDIREHKLENLILSEQINSLFYYKSETLHMCDLRRWGTDKTGGPLWLSKYLLYTKPLEGYHQVVGHTFTDEPKYYKKNDQTSVMFCDCLESYQKPIILEL